MTDGMDLIGKLRDQLNEGWARVEFTKADGTDRSMLCTRNFVDVPDEHKPKGEGKAKEDLLVVFDLEKQSWRSIRYSSIKSWIAANRLAD